MTPMTPSDAGTPNTLLPTPSQTVGPFLSIGMTWADGEGAVPADTEGAIWIRGTVRDGAGDPVPDAAIETWQADAHGGFEHAVVEDRIGDGALRGFGRSLTRPDGSWSVRTVKPGAVSDGHGGWQAPHLDVSILARGLLHRLVTRIYFADEVEANAADPVLTALPADADPASLLANPEDGPDGTGYRFDIVLQGAGETIFFAL